MGKCDVAELAKLVEFVLNIGGIKTTKDNDDDGVMIDICTDLDGEKFGVAESPTISVKSNGVCMIFMIIYNEGNFLQKSKRRKIAYTIEQAAREKTGVTCLSTHEYGSIFNFADILKEEQMNVGEETDLVPLISREVNKCLEFIQIINSSLKEFSLK